MVLAFGFPGCLISNQTYRKLKVRDKGERREKRKKGGDSVLTCCGAIVNGWAPAYGLAAENPLPAETDFLYQACRRWFPASQNQLPPFLSFPCPFTPFHYLLQLTTLPLLRLLYFYYDSVSYYLTRTTY